MSCVVVPPLSSPPITNGWLNVAESLEKVYATYVVLEPGSSTRGAVTVFVVAPVAVAAIEMLPPSVNNSELPIAYPKLCRGVRTLRRR